MSIWNARIYYYSYVIIKPVPPSKRSFFLTLIFLILYIFSSLSNSFFFMGIFSNFFRRLSRREGRKKAKSTLSFNQKQKNALMENSASSSNSISPTTSLVPNSKDGKSFKYNDAGRQYHGMDDVAYVLPNDDDGN